MPHIMNKTILSEGTERIVMHYYIESDGSADFNLEPFLDPQLDVDVPMGAVIDSGSGLMRIPRLALVEAWYHMNGISTTFVCEGSPNFTALVLTPGDDSHSDYRRFGGIKDMTVTNKQQPGRGSIILGGTGSTAQQDGYANSPLDASHDPKAVPDNQPNRPMPRREPLENANLVQSIPAFGTGRWLITTQGMSVPSLTTSW